MDDRGHRKLLPRINPKGATEEVGAVLLARTLEKGWACTWPVGGMCNVGFKWSDSLKVYLRTAILDDGQLPPQAGGGIHLQALNGRFFFSGNHLMSWGRRAQASGTGTAAPG